MASILQKKALIIRVNLVQFMNSLRTKQETKQLIITEHGDPLEVLEMNKGCLPSLGDNGVLVKMLAAPINPSDLNTIQGTYPVKIKFPHVLGDEGVGIVMEIGNKVTKVALGNKVVIIKPTQGTWRNYAVFNENVLRCVPRELRIIEAATLVINPCLSYRLLSDFTPLRSECKKSVVIQNGANSACGQNIIQLCKAWGIPNVNIIRSRPNIDMLKGYLYNLGATCILTEEELKSTSIFRNNTFERPSLALNCVGGKSAQLLMRQLKNSATLVTYGGMSRKSINIPTGLFIFKNISFLGFWLAEWEQNATECLKERMLSEIISLMCEYKLKAPIHKIIAFDNFKEGITETLSPKGYSGCKYILDFTK